MNQALQISSPIGLIAAGGVLPFAVADSLVARNISPVFFALRGVCDPLAGGAVSSSLDFNRATRQACEPVAG